MRPYNVIYFAIATLLLTSCHKVIEPQRTYGFISQADEQQLIIENDTATIRQFLLDESTEIVGGGVVEGNIVEVIYLPSEEGLPQALSITTDQTYVDALGRWATEDETTQLPIAITLEPRGRISQSLPQQIMQFTSWELTGIEDEILLHGTLSLPPDWAKWQEENKRRRNNNNDERAPLPERREREFTTRARLDKQSDNNTESRRVLVFSHQNRESKLYFQE